MNLTAQQFDRFAREDGSTHGVFCIRGSAGQILGHGNEQECNAVRNVVPVPDGYSIHVKPWGAVAKIFGISQE